MTAIARLPGRAEAARKAPAHLRAPTRKWWSEIADDFELEAHHLRLLTLAAEAWDRGEQARQEISRRGAFFEDRFGTPHAHPAIAIERDSRIAFARLIRELALDVDPPRDTPRPQALGR